MGKHVDDVVKYGIDYPHCLRWYLFVERLPAAMKMLVFKEVGEPRCFADYKGERVRLVMASRFGDIGITTNLDKNRGYQKRVSVDELTNFGKSPE